LIALFALFAKTKLLSIFEIFEIDTRMTGDQEFRKMLAITRCSVVCAAFFVCLIGDKYGISVASSLASSGHFVHDGFLVVTASFCIIVCLADST
jgi:hypothetical protein